MYLLLLYLTFPILSHIQAHMWLSGKIESEKQHTKNDLFDLCIYPLVVELISCAYVCDRNRDVRIKRIIVIGITVGFGYNHT